MVEVISLSAIDLEAVALLRIYRERMAETNNALLAVAISVGFALLGVAVGWLSSDTIGAACLLCASTVVLIATRIWFSTFQREGLALAMRSRRFWALIDRLRAETE